MHFNCLIILGPIDEEKKECHVSDRVRRAYSKDEIARALLKRVQHTSDNDIGCSSTTSYPSPHCTFCGFFPPKAIVFFHQCVAT